MDKEKSTEKIDGAVATVMALDRAIRNEGSDGSVYDDNSYDQEQYNDYSPDGYNYDEEY